MSVTFVALYEYSGQSYAIKVKLNPNSQPNDIFCLQQLIVFITDVLLQNSKTDGKNLPVDPTTGN